MDGWIKIHRKIDRHWIWSDSEYLKWWIDLILMAAFEDTEVSHDTHVFILKRGQMIMSIADLCKRWGKSRNMILRYISRLENEDMLMREVRYRQTPVITICNYDSYQVQEDRKRDRQKDTQKDRQKDRQKDTLSKERKENIPHTPYKENKENILEEIKNNPPIPPLEGGTSPKDIFENFYNKTFGEYYYWTGKDAGQMTQLMNKIKFSRESKGMPIDDKSLNEALGKLLGSITDKWLLDNLSVSNINSKYNEIVASAKNVKYNKSDMNIGVVLNERPKYKKGW